MNDIKMYNLFPSAFQEEIDVSFEVEDIVWYSYGKRHTSHSGQDEAIKHAVLNHDRLVEENAELRDSESQLVNETEDLKCEIEDLREALVSLDAISSLMASEIYEGSLLQSHVNKLLTKHK